MRIKMIIEYDGTHYHGWQRQKDHPTIQQVLEETIEKITHEKIHVSGSGRTDSGVHALAQVAHCDLPPSINLEKFQKALNGMTPPDIIVKKILKTSSQFHAQYSVQTKTYVYQIHNALYPSALYKHLSWWIPKPLDLRKMKEAACLLIGEHDFKAFQNQGTHVVTTTRTVFISRFKKKDPFIIYEITGNGFLRQMVRNIVGALVDVGKGRMDIEEFKTLLESRDRTRGSAPARAQGLILQKVQY